MPFVNEKFIYFPIYNPKQIEVLYGPKEYYQTLIVNKIFIIQDGVSNAENRIFLSCLYLGTGELARGLLAAIEGNLKKNKNLQVTLLLDKCRGLRGYPGDSSVTVIKPLLEKYPKKYLYIIIVFNYIYMEHHIYMIFQMVLYQVELMKQLVYIILKHMDGIIL